MQPRHLVGGEQLPVVGSDGLDRAERAVCQQLADDVGARQEPRPHRLHDGDLTAAGGDHNPAGLLGVAGERLLHQHVLACLDRQQCLVSVLAVRGRDVDDVHLRVGDQVGIGAVDGRDAELVGESPAALGRAGTDGDQPLARRGAQGGGEHVGDPARRHDAPVQGRRGHRIGHPRGGQ